MSKDRVVEGLMQRCTNDIQGTCQLSVFGWTSVRGRWREVLMILRAELHFTTTNVLKCDKLKGKALTQCEGI